MTKRRKKTKINICSILTLISLGASIFLIYNILLLGPIEKIIRYIIVGIIVLIDIFIYKKNFKLLNKKKQNKKGFIFLMTIFIIINILIGKSINKIYSEIDKINKALKEINSDSVLEEVTKANSKLDRIDLDKVITEIHRVETIVSEINENAVLSELERVKQLINEKNSSEVMNNLDAKIKTLNSKDYTDKLLELQDDIKKNAVKIDELTSKVERVATMPTMLKSIIERNNEDNLKKTEELLLDINNRERKKFDSIKVIVNINLWVAILTAAVLIANIMGVI